MHYDLTEDDLEDLFSRIAPVRELKLQYDRAGRSDGTAFVTYDHIADARTAVKEFDGANAKGQPIRLSILPLPPRVRTNPFDRAENPRSLFDRIESNGRRRSESPEMRDSRRNDRRERSERGPERGSDRGFGSDRGRGRGRGVGRERPTRDGPRPGARPKKTQDQLDAEMDDYWKGTGGAAGDSAPAKAQGGDDDIDMIE